MNRRHRWLATIAVALSPFLAYLVSAGSAQVVHATSQSPPAPQAQATIPGPTSHYTATTTRVWHEKLGRFLHFTPRHHMRRRAQRRASRGAWPTPKLPVGIVQPAAGMFPMDANDQYGDCGEAMVAHADTALVAMATGKPSTFDASKLVSQYLAVSGGDNGLDEQEVTQQIWAAPNGIAGASPPGAVIYDHLDLPDLSPATVQGAIAAQGVVCMAFDVPNAWIDSFDPSKPVVWDVGLPNPMNGHYVALVGVDAQGRYVLLTWGGYVYLTQRGLESCNAELFTVFSPRGFDAATGNDFNDIPYAQATAAWASRGGSPSLPPWPYGPTPTPAPVPTPAPTPTPSPPGPTPAAGVVTVDPATLTVAIPWGWTVVLGRGKWSMSGPGTFSPATPTSAH